MSMTIDEAFAERHAILLVPARSLAETREAHAAAAKRLVCSFCVPGQPLPKQRARVVNGHGFTPRKTRDNEAAIRDLARAAMNGQPSYAGPVKLEARFYRADARKVDLDNLCKQVLDSIQMVPARDARGKRKARAAQECVLVNDSQVREIHCFLSIDREHPRAVVRVEALP